MSAIDFPAAASMQVVAVGERPAELVGEEPPDGGLAGAAVADEEDALGVHDVVRAGYRSSRFGTLALVAAFSAGRSRRRR